jgi:hypothetical protein
MALRFRCEHCGKKLQVNMEPGAEVACPYCHNTVTVPADAQQYDPAQAQASQQAGQPQQGEEAPPEEESGSDAVIAMMATYLPSWGTSVVLHLAVVLLMLMFSWSANKKEEETNYQAKSIVEKKTVVKHERSAEKSKQPNKALRRDVSSFAYKPTENPTPDVAAFNVAETVDVIGSTGGRGGSGFGGIPGEGFGRGGGTGGKFFGQGGGAKRIVYVVDRSGSITDSMMYVKFELRRAIRSLDSTQNFYVIFFSSGPAVPMPSGKMVQATESNKMMAGDFIDGIVPVGQTDPSEALKMAFAEKPEEIHLLTDGEFDKKIVPLIDSLNKGKTVKVHTLCFLYSQGEPILQEIALKNNGKYKYISDVDLQGLGASGR